MLIRSGIRRHFKPSAEPSTPSGGGQVMKAPASILPRYREAPGFAQRGLQEDSGPLKNH